MSGRAGRRGKDVVGICLIAPGAYSDARVVHQLLQRPPEPLRSAYFAAPSSVLNLLKYRSTDELRYIVQKSLAAFLDRKAGVRLRDESKALEATIKSDESYHGERLKKAEKRVRRILKEAEDLEGKQATQLEIALTGLTKLGYIEGASLTVKGQWAANLCTSLVLELAEAIESGLLYDLSVEELAAVVGSIAGDSHRTYFSLKKNPIKPQYFEAMREIVTKVKASFDNRQTSEIGVVPDAALTVLTWMESPSWVDFAGLLRLAGVAEGDAARVIMQTADHLSQISRLEESHPPLAAAASEARRRLLRPPLSEALIEG
jgi:superfamily II RNA helicase